MRFDEQIAPVSAEDPKLLTPTELKYLQAKQELMRGFSRFPDRASQVAEKYGVDISALEMPEKQADTVPLVDLFNSYFILKGTQAKSTNEPTEDDMVEDVSNEDTGDSSGEEDTEGSDNDFIVEN